MSLNSCDVNVRIIRIFWWLHVSR